MQKAEDPRRLLTPRSSKKLNEPAYPRSVQQHVNLTEPCVSLAEPRNSEPDDNHRKISTRTLDVKTHPVEAKK